MTYEDEDRALRTLIREVDPPPSRVDIASTVRRGRRGQRLRRSATLAAAALVTGAVAAAVAITDGRAPAIGTAVPQTAGSAPAIAPGHVRCTVAKVEHPAGAVSVEAVDVTGRRMVGTVTTGVDSPMWLWTDGRPELLDGAFDGLPTDVNSAGTVVGWSPVPASGPDTSSWVYRDGRMSALPPPPGYPSVAARGVNERGDVVGIARRGAQFAVAVLWRAEAPDRPVLITEQIAETVDIADDGTIAGSLYAGTRQGDEDFRGKPIVGFVRTPDGAIATFDSGGPSKVRGAWAVGRDASRTGFAVVNLLTRTSTPVPGYAAVNDRGFVAVVREGAMTVTKPDGTRSLLASSDGSPVTGRMPFWLSNDGRTLITATVVGESPPLFEYRVWQCD